MSPVVKVGEGLTHCCECGLPFWGPVANWDDFFSVVEDASFMCASCAEREGIEVPGVG